MIKPPKNREEYLVRCVDLQSIKPSSEYWARRVQLADVYIYALEARIAEIEKQSRSEALIRCELEEEIDFFTRSMHFTPANTYEVLTGRIKELEAALRLADEEYQNVIMLYYNEEYAPSNYERWIKAAYERWIKTEPEQELGK